MQSWIVLERSREKQPAELRPNNSKAWWKLETRGVSFGKSRWMLRQKRDRRASRVIPFCWFSLFVMLHEMCYNRVEYKSWLTSCIFQNCSEGIKIIKLGSKVKLLAQNCLGRCFVHSGEAELFQQTWIIFHPVNVVEDGQGRGTKFVKLPYKQVFHVITKTMGNVDSKV